MYDWCRPFYKSSQKRVWSVCMYSRGGLFKIDWGLDFSCSAEPRLLWRTPFITKLSGQRTIFVILAKVTNSNIWVSTRYSLHTIFKIFFFFHGGFQLWPKKKQTIKHKKDEKESDKNNKSHGVLQLYLPKYRKLSRDFYSPQSALLSSTRNVVFLYEWRSE